MMEPLLIASPSLVQAADPGSGFALANFLARWSGGARHDLSASESATLTLPSLLNMADEEDRLRWQQLDFGYASPHGAPWLRATIAGRHQGLDASNVLCSAGAQEGLTCVMRAMLKPADHAIVVVPIYQPTEQAVTSSCDVTGVALRAENHFALDVGEVAAAITPRTKLVLINFPNSPTGAVIDPVTFSALVQLCRRHGLWLVNDEVYRSIGDDPALIPPPVAEVYERGISIDAMSKGFGLPGLRVGWVLCQDRQVLADVLLAKSSLSSCLATPSEVLAEIALKAETQILQRNRAVARSNRDRLLALIDRHSDLLEAVVSPDAVLAFPRYLQAQDAAPFAERLARDAGILVLPSGIWRSPLAWVPTDRLRIGLGRVEAKAALAALDDYLTLLKQAAN